MILCLVFVLFLLQTTGFIIYDSFTILICPIYTPSHSVIYCIFVNAEINKFNIS